MANNVQPAPAFSQLITAVTTELKADLAPTFEKMEWAEDEIKKARQRHPAHADRIWHSFSLLTPTHALMNTEFVYRSHCAELLSRVADGGDTRLGTAAEVCCAMHDTTLATPVRSSVVGMYMRMWKAAGFPGIPEFDEALGHHEALEQTTIDDHEHFVRRTLNVTGRHLGGVTCDGLHHGVRVSCTFTG